ncbi:hypothetical protein BDF19DRAFT_451217 [Syncephalis fuscata]|nr:hypothetical protein BDF19DRAFT_451217 [Syncephalis fuscata]
MGSVHLSIRFILCAIFGNNGVLGTVLVYPSPSFSICFYKNKEYHMCDEVWPDSKYGVYGDIKTYVWLYLPIPYIRVVSITQGSAVRQAF